MVMWTGDSTLGLLVSVVRWTGDSTLGLLVTAVSGEVDWRLHIRPASDCS